MSSIPAPRPVAEYVAEGARIAAILLIWGLLAAVFTHGITELGLPFERLWRRLGRLFALTGVLNAVLYVLYRTVSYWHHHE